MAYVELYTDKVFELINLGKTIRQFNESNGDYLMVQIFKENSVNPINELYSNKLLFRTSDDKSYYFGDYHYHPENPDMGFCSGKVHGDSSMMNLKPLIKDGVVENLNLSENYLKQVTIYKDDSDNIFIKPNEIIKVLNLPAARYRLRVHFKRKISANLGSFLNLMKNNLIENGNFFSGLEATQAGDIDKSKGKNNFVRILNPGFSPFVLNQTGIVNNEYVMKVTGIEPNSNYVFSCWVAWDEKYNGGAQIVSFSDVSSQGISNGFAPVSNTSIGGSFLNDESDIILKEKELDGLKWFKLYSFVATDGNADLGSIMVHLGLNDMSDEFFASTNPLGNRFFTDLRLEKIESLSGQTIENYLNELKLENYMSEYQYSVASYNSLVKSNMNVETPSGDIMVSDTLENLPETESVNNMLQNLNVDGVVDGILGDPNLDTEDTNMTMKKGGMLSKRTQPKFKRRK